MAATLRREPGNIHRLEISGRLRKHELDVVQQSVAAEIRGGARIRLLIVLAGFLGWEADASWRDLSFYVRYGDAIERIAITGDEAWRSESLMFVGADLRAAAVRFFPLEAETEAMSWLAA
jgi:hypothetical protein